MQIRPAAYGGAVFNTSVELTVYACANLVLLCPVSLANSMSVILTPKTILMCLTRVIRMGFLYF